MPYDSVTNRTNVAPLIPEEVQRNIVQNVAESSAILRLATRLPNMTRNQLRMPVLSALPTAYFVSGDTGLKQTSAQAWENKYINAEELAVIIPVPENVFNDADYDLWSEIEPRIIEAFGVAIDQAIYYGTNAPANWPDDLLTGATSASHTVTQGSGDDLYEEIMGVGGLLSFVEEDGYEVSGHVAALQMRSRLRGLRDANGVPLFMQSLQPAVAYALDGVPVEFPLNGAVDATEALLLSGDFRKIVYSIRQDVSLKVFTEGVVQDGSGNIIHNLMQQDMIALRATMRLGWELPIPASRVANSPYPFAAFLPAS